MLGPHAQNDLLIATMDMLISEDVDLSDSEAAFVGTRGDFRAKLRAALEARFAQLAQPEVFVELPEDPTQVRSRELDELVRPVAAGFLRSTPPKAELVAQAHRVARRQRDRPAWVPRTDPDGRPLAPDPAGDPDRTPDRPVVIRAFPELGEVTVQLPGALVDRPELEMASGGAGAWESALQVALGVGEPGAPDSQLGVRPGSSAGPAAISELLATAETLAGVVVEDATPAAAHAVVEAFDSVGDWRFSARWLQEDWDPDGSATLSVARSALAGWADETGSGLVLCAYGGAMHDLEGTFGVHGLLHGYLLVARRSGATSDQLSTVHRLTVHCPGPDRCRRGGCPDLDHPEVVVLLEQVAAHAFAAESAQQAHERFATSYEQLYGDTDPDWPDELIELAAHRLQGHGWTELSRSSWEGGLQTLLAWRGQHCLQLDHDPVTRQVAIHDGVAELELSLDLQADDGVLTESGDLARTEAAEELWGAELLDAAEAFLRGDVVAAPARLTSRQLTVLGLHPHADGSLRGPRSVELATLQLDHLIESVGAQREA